MRLIDADALIYYLANKQVDCDSCTDIDCLNCVIEYAIKSAPTINPDDCRPHGRWIYHDCVSTYDGTKSGYSCSNCGAFITEDEFDMPGCYTDFCGSCGAKMEGKEQNQ